MSQQNLPDLRAMSRRLADHNNRVTRYVEALPRRVDKLVEATRSRDWSEVRRLSEFLACSSDIFGCSEVAQAAHRVCQEVDEPDNEMAVKRSVIRLISSCGALPEQVAAQTISTLDVHSSMPAEALQVEASITLAPMAIAPPSSIKSAPRTKHSKVNKAEAVAGRRAPRGRKTASRSAR